MPIGRPDWYNVGLAENVSSMADMAELAVRLGGPVNFDRTGKVIWQDLLKHYDTFWSESSLNLLSGPIVDTDTYEFGESSLKTEITLGAANYISLSYNVRMWQNGLLSVEMGCAFDQYPTYVDLITAFTQDGVAYTFGVRLSQGFGQVNYRDSAGAWQSHALNTNHYGATDMFNAIKLDVDMSTQYYIRARVNDETFDLSAYAGQSNPSSTPNRLTATIQCYAHNTANTTFWLDRVMLTEDE